MINELIEVVGRESVSLSKIDKLAYSSDASQLKGKAIAVIWPKTTEQIQKIIEYAIKHNLNIVPRGGGTGLAGAVVPYDSIVLDFSRMNKILEINKAKKYAVVQPGVILDDLNFALENLFFPVIPSSHEVCTLGGMIATNAAGLRAIKYGKVENWIKELEIIDGKAKLLEMKADKIKDFCGKEGTTGIIVKAKLKLAEPVKEKSVTLFNFGDINKLIQLVKALRLRKDIIALEFIDKKASKLINLDKRYSLIVEFGTLEGEITDPKKIEEIWKLRDGLYSTLASEGFCVIEDPSLGIEKILTLLKWLEENNIPSFGHLGVGIIHPCFKKDSREISELFKLVKKLNGSISSEHGIGLLKKDFVSKDFANEIKRLKKEYDPNNILNPGKIIWN